MPSTYEFWLTDDAGNKIMLLDNYSFFSYSRSTKGFGTLEIGMPYIPFTWRINPVFQPDRRISVWRSPGIGYPMRREEDYLLRMPRIYTREDGVDLLTFYGRDPKDLLNRRYVIQASGTAYTRKTDYIDDLMKAIVREQMLFGSSVDVDGVADEDRAYPRYEFIVQDDLGLGPTMIYNFGDRNVLDTLKELRDASDQLYLDNPTNRRIFFDVVPIEVQTSIIEILDAADPSLPILDEEGRALLDERSASANASSGFRFETRADLYGMDRTTGVVFSKENNNLKFPSYSKSHLEEINTVIVKGFGRADSREYDVIQNTANVNLSRWNRCEGFKDASNEPDQANLAEAGKDTLYKGRPDEQLNAVFMSVPGGPDSPRSLYGIDWDLGDLLPVEYAGKRFNVEVDIVYVAIDENGVETITGRNSVNESDEI